MPNAAPTTPPDVAALASPKEAQRMTRLTIEHFPTAKEGKEEPSTFAVGVTVAEVVAFVLARAVLDREGAGTTDAGVRVDTRPADGQGNNTASVPSPAPVVASEQQVAEAWDKTRETGARGVGSIALCEMRWSLLSKAERERILAFARALTAPTNAAEDTQRIEWLNSFVGDNRFDLDMNDLCYGHKDLREAIDAARSVSPAGGTPEGPRP